MQIEDILRSGPVVPVIVLDDAETAVPLARALLEGGVRVLEITLRTPAGLELIRRVLAEVPDAIVGAGTVLTPDQLGEVERLGAAFAVSPGATRRCSTRPPAAPCRSCPARPRRARS